MPTHPVHGLDNDDARAFVTEVVSVGGVALLVDTLTRANAVAEPDLALSRHAVAAAELMAAGLGHTAAMLPAEAATWAARHAAALDPLPARQALLAVLAHSALATYWRANGAHQAWMAAIFDLLLRLRGPAPMSRPAAPLTILPPRRPLGTVPSVPPRDPRGLEILRRWIAGEGGAPAALTDDDRQYARHAGWLPPDRVLDHDAAIAWACQAMRIAGRLNVANAFLASLSTRRLDVRSALGSYAVGLHLAMHPFTPYQQGMLCTTCGILTPGAFTYRLAAMNYERHTWGGLQHESPAYLAFDLMEFAKLPPCVPTDEDVTLWRRIIARLRRLPITAGAEEAAAAIEGLLPATNAECRHLIMLLGYAGILQPECLPSFHVKYVRYVTRSRLEREGWPYPVAGWRGADGVNAQALAYFFGHVG